MKNYEEMKVVELKAEAKRLGVKLGNARSITKILLA